MSDTPQANPKPHPVDYVALGLIVLGALAEFADVLPPKFSGALMVLMVGARLYTKWLGSQTDKDALAEGTSVGADLKSDLKVIEAKKPL